MILICFAHHSTLLSTVSWDFSLLGAARLLSLLLSIGTILSNVPFLFTEKALTFRVQFGLLSRRHLRSRTSRMTSTASDVNIPGRQGATTVVVIVIVATLIVAIA